MQIRGRSGAAAQTVVARDWRRDVRARADRQAEPFVALKADVPSRLVGTVLRAGTQDAASEPPLNDGGSVALWLSLGQFGRATPDWQHLDDELCPFGVTSSAGGFLEAARDRGLDARLYNHGTFDELAHETRRGRAVMVVTTREGDVSPTWTRLTRAWRDRLGRRWVETQRVCGTRDVVRFERFNTEWKNRRLSGFDCAFVLIDRRTARPLPATTADDVLAALAFSDGSQHLARGVDALLRGKPAVGLGHLLGGVSLLALGLMGSLLALPGLLLERAGDAMLELAQRCFQDGGVAVVPGALAGLSGLVTRGSGMIGRSFGNAVGFIGQAFNAVTQGGLPALSRLLG